MQGRLAFLLQIPPYKAHRPQSLWQSVDFRWLDAAFFPCIFACLFCFVLFKAPCAPMAWWWWWFKISWKALMAPFCLLPGSSVGQGRVTSLDALGMCPFRVLSCLMIMSDGAIVYPSALHLHWRLGACSTTPKNTPVSLVLSQKVVKFREMKTFPTLGPVGT